MNITINSIEELNRKVDTLDGVAHNGFNLNLNVDFNSKSDVRLLEEFLRISKHGYEQQR